MILNKIMLAMVTAPIIFMESPPTLPKKAPNPESRLCFTLELLNSSKRNAPRKTPIEEPIMTPGSGEK